MNTNDKLRAVFADMDKIENIIWDFDGTLVDTYPTMTRTLQSALETVEIYAPYEEVYKLIKISMDHALSYYSKGNNQVKEAIRRHYSSIEKEVDASEYMLFGDTLDAVAHIKKLGIRQFILTHRGASTLEITQAFGLADYIEDTIISNHGFRRKPDPEAFNFLINKHSLIPQKTLSVGDRKFDVEAGQNAGTLGCLIIDKYNEKYSDAAEFCVTSRAQLADALSKRTGGTYESK